MTNNEYQQAAVSTAVFPEEVTWSYLPLKLAGEAGEVAEKFGKAFRKHGSWFLENDDVGEDWITEVIKELGDVQWYIAVMAAKLGYSLEEVQQKNIDKLFDRKDRGVLHGNGDNR